jgi:hypothetical protein
MLKTNNRNKENNVLPEVRAPHLPRLTVNPWGVTVDTNPSEFVRAVVGAQRPVEL